MNATRGTKLLTGVSLLSALLVVAVALAPTAEVTAAWEKMDVCHVTNVPEDGHGVVISIADPAWDAHEAHGDKEIGQGAEDHGDGTCHILPTKPYIEPNSGPPTTSFVITDPQGRMVVADLIIITPEGESPEQGIVIKDAWFSADGKTAGGTVPALAQTGWNYVSVHAVRPTEPPLFNALLFVVTV